MQTSNFTDGSLSGIVTVGSGRTSFIKTLTNNLTTDGLQTFVVNLRTGSSSGPIVATSPLISVFDTSVPLVVAPAITNLYDSIQGLASYMSGFMSDYKNPSFYSYNLDGDATYIVDGGNDMYDNGNFTTPWLIAGTNYTSNSGTVASYTSRISYSNTTATLVDTNFTYASLGYGTSPDKRPLTVIGTRTGTGNPIGWQKGGNSGADGSGTLLSGFAYNGTVINGFTTYAYIRETSGAVDPSHCDLYILLGHSNWDSTFGTINTFADPVSNGGCGGYLYTSGAGVKNILAITTLLSKASAAQVTTAECQTVTTNIINRVKLYFGF